MEEQMSCEKPGKVNGNDRQAPPIVDCASITSTDIPAVASVIAADSPLTPEPITTASYDVLLARSLMLEFIYEDGYSMPKSPLIFSAGVAFGR